MRCWPWLLSVVASLGFAEGAFADAAAPSARVLTLEAALARARAQSPTVRSASAQRDAADAREDRARGVLLPQLIGTASYTRTTGNYIPRPGQLPSTINQSSVKSTWDMYNSYNFSLNASVLLYDFQGSIDRFRAAKETNRASVERVRAAELTVDLAVRNAFFQARAERALIEVARETLANNERHVEQIQAFVDVGTRPEIDLLQVRTDVANARVSLVQAENNYALAKVNLQRAMGVEELVDFEVADQQLGQLSGEDAPLADLLKEALQARPDVLASRRDLSASELSAEAAKGVFGPSVSALATGTRGGVDLDDLRWNVGAGVQLNWSLVRGGGSFAEVREARANVRGVEASVADMRQAVRVQVEQARLAVQAAVATIAAAQEALENAKGRLALAEGRYQAGVGNIIELGDAQVALTQAEAQSVSAEYSLSLARAQLLSALGRSQ